MRAVVNTIREHTCEVDQVECQKNTGRAGSGGSCSHMLKRERRSGGRRITRAARRQRRLQKYDRYRGRKPTQRKDDLNGYRKSGFKRRSLLSSLKFVQLFLLHFSQLCKLRILSYVTAALGMHRLL